MTSRKDMFLKKLREREMKKMRLREREMKKMRKEMIDACTKGNRKQIIALVKRGCDVDTGHLRIAAGRNDCQVSCVLQLICFGARITDKVISEAHRDIRSLLKHIKNGVNLMSDKEKRYVWSFKFALVNVQLRNGTRIASSTARKVSIKICSFITFRNSFMAYGYHIGSWSIWRKKVRKIKIPTIGPGNLGDYSDKWFPHYGM